MKTNTAMGIGTVCRQFAAYRRNLHDANADGVQALLLSKKNLLEILESS
jgi:hypothetical protein